MKSLTKKQRILIITGLAVLLFHSFVLYAIFLEAFANNFIAVFEINVYGEAYPEFIYMPVSLVLGAYAVLKTVKILRRER